MEPRSQLRIKGCRHCDASPKKRKSKPYARRAARLSQSTEPGLFESGTFDGGQRTFPNGCHVVEVEIDQDTGAVALVRYHAVEDVGHMINPLLVAGQLHGGIAQGAKC